MLPVLFSIGKIPVSSFGVFLAIGFLFGIFLIWRLARAWDLNEEKILDLILVTFLGGMLGARIYYAMTNLQLFISSPLDLVLLNKVPGLSFWGGFLGGWLTLFVFAKRKRLNFWQLTDMAVAGLLAGMVFADIGCFFGGCNVGIQSKAFFAVTQAGVLGKRLPIQLIESGLLVIVLIKIWSKATHFHQRGQIIALGLIFVGIVKLILEPLKQNHADLIFSGLLVVLGLTILRKVTKKNPVDLKGWLTFFLKLLRNHETRDLALQKFNKYWYNQKTNLSWKARNLKKFLRRSNVKFS